MGRGKVFKELRGFTGDGKCGLGVYKGDGRIIGLVFRPGVDIDLEMDEKELYRRAWDYDYVVTGVDGEGVIYKNVIFPKNIGDKELKEAVRFQFLDLDSSEYVMECIKTGFQTGEDESYICVGVPKELIREAIGGSENIYTGLDLEPVAFWRGFNLRNPGVKKPLMIVARRKDKIVIVAGRERLEFVRVAYLGALGVESEVKRTADYYRRAFNAVSTEVAEVGDEDYVKCVLTGYSGACEDSGFVNLLSKGYRRKKRITLGVKEGWFIWGAVFLAVVFAGILGAGFFYQGRANLIEEGVAEKKRMIGSLEKYSKEAKEYRDEIGMIKGFKVESYIGVVDDIRKSVPEDVVITELEIGGDLSEGAGMYKVRTVRLEGESLSVSSLGVFIDRLNSLGYVEEASLVDGVGYKEDLGVYSFGVRLSIRV